MKRYIALLLCFTSLLLGCKKYDEGPSITFRTPKNRVTENWKIVRHVVGGKEDTNWSSTNMVEQFKKNGDYSRIVNGSYITGTWEFSKDRDQIFVTFSTNLSYPYVYHVRKLKNDELHYMIRYPSGAGYAEHHFYGEPE